MSDLNNPQPQAEESSIALKWIVKSGFWIFVTLIVSKILFYVYRIIIAREFGVEVYGLYSIAFFIFLLFSTLSNFGIERGVLRFVAYYHTKNNQDRIKGIIIDSFKIGIPFSFFIGTCMFFLSEFIAINIFHNNRLIILIKIFSLGIPFAYIFNILSAYLQSIEKNVLANMLNNVVSNIIRIILLIVLLFMGIQIPSIGYSYTIGYFIMAIIYIYYSKLSRILLNKNINAIANKKELLLYSWPLFASAVIIQLQSMTDTTFLGYYMTAFEVGLYNAALPIAGLVATLPVIIYPLIIPLLTKMYSKKDDENIKIIYARVIKWMVAVNLPIALLIICFPEAFLNLFFGKEFLGAGGVLSILTFSSLLMSICLIPFFSLEIIKKTKLIMLISLLFLFVNIILDIILIPRMGIIGASISTLVSTIFMCIISLSLSYKYFKAKPFSNELYKIIFSVIPSLLFLLVMRYFFKVGILSLIIIFILFCFIYFILTVKFKVYDEIDIEIIQAIEKRIKIPISKYIKIIS